MPSATTAAGHGIGETRAPADADGRVRGCAHGARAGNARADAPSTRARSRSAGAAKLRTRSGNEASAQRSGEAATPAPPRAAKACRSRRLSPCPRMSAALPSALPNVCRMSAILRRALRAPTAHCSTGCRTLNTPASGPKTRLQAQGETQSGLDALQVLGRHRAEGAFDELLVHRHEIREPRRARVPEPDLAPVLQGWSPGPGVV